VLPLLLVAFGFQCGGFVEMKQAHSLIRSGAIKKFKKAKFSVTIWSKKEASDLVSCYVISLAMNIHG